MRLLRIRLENVRGIDACEVRIARDGVTVVEAPNESGKTTLLDAVDVLLDMKDTSKAQRVKDLQPVGMDVGSTIEVELISGATHLSCTKTFNRQTATTLQVHAPTAQQLGGTEAHDRLREILEAEVDLDLYAALRFPQGRDLQAVPLQNSPVLAARLDAVAGGSGSTDGDGLLDRVTDEFARYFTPGGAARKALAEVDARVKEIQTDHDAVCQQLIEVAGDVDELGAIDDELPSLTGRLSDEIEPRVAALDEQLASIRSQAQVVATRTAERDRACQARDSARRDVRERAEKAAFLGELTDDVETLEAGLDPVRSRQRELEERLTACDRDLAEAVDAARVARSEREVAEILVDLSQARRQRDELAARHDRVRTVIEEARDADAALRTIILDAPKLAAIREAQRNHDVAVATLAAGAPTVRVHARRPIDLTSDGVSTTVDTDASWETMVGDRFHLDVPDHVEVEVRAGGSTDELHRAVVDARERLVAACEGPRVDDLDHAERVAEQRAAHETTVRHRDDALQRELGTATVEELASDWEQGDARVTALAARLPDGVAEPPDQQTALRRLDAARPAAEAADDRVADLRADRDAAREELAAVRTRAATDEATLVQRREQAAREQAALTEARAAASDDDLDAYLAQMESELAAATAALTDAEAELAGLDPVAVELDARNWQQQRTDTQARIRTLSERRAALRARLDVVGEQGLGEREQDLDQQLARALADQRRIHARAAAARVLHDALTTARGEAYRTYRTPLTDRILDLARLLYRRDVDIALGDDLAIVTRTLDGVTLAWEQLSAGAREQLAILSALAAAQLAGGDGVPFVLDDALGYTDPLRLERLGALLGQTTDAQVIVLTCVADRFRHVGGATVVRLLEARGDPSRG